MYLISISQNQCKLKTIQKQDKVGILTIMAAYSTVSWFD